MAWYQRHNFDNRGCKEMEEDSTVLFLKLAKAKGWIAKEANSYQDRIEHWDVQLDKKTASHKVDIKGLKRIDSWKEPDDSLLLVEYSNVSGNNGWLRGKADYIAFLVKEGFAFVPRVKLLEYTSSLVDWASEPLPSPRNKVKHVLYQRSQWGRKDLFVYLTKKEILSLKTICWRTP